LNQKITRENLGANIPLTKDRKTVNHDIVPGNIASATKILASDENKIIISANNYGFPRPGNVDLSKTLDETKLLVIKNFPVA
jgi:hypothetical protein